MGAHHFLDHDFDLPDATSAGEIHTMELFETGGQRYLRIWIGGRGKGQQLMAKLTRAQSEAISEAADDLKTRIAD